MAPISASCAYPLKKREKFSFNTIDPDKAVFSTEKYWAQLFKASLTSSLRVISLTVLADSIYHIMIFFAEKM